MESTFIADNGNEIIKRQLVLQCCCTAHCSNLTVLDFGEVNIPNSDNARYWFEINSILPQKKQKELNKFLNNFYMNNIEMEEFLGAFNNCYDSPICFYTSKGYALILKKVDNTNLFQLFIFKNNMKRLKHKRIFDITLTKEQVELFYNTLKDWNKLV